MLLTVVQERSGRTLLLSDVLERQRRDDNRAKEYGDAAQINRLEISKAAGLECVVHDVTLRRRARMLSYNFVFGPQQVTVRWLFRDSAGFAEFKPAVDGVLRTFAFSGDPKDPNPHPVEIDK
jgi:hypothetical protein